MSLPILVAQDKWQEFDDAWTTQMGADGPVDDLVRALRLVAAKKKMPRCLPMLREHAELLAAADRPADAARVVGVAIAGGAATGEMGDLLYQNALQAWGGEPFWEVYGEVSHFAPGAPDLRRAWAAFERLQSFQPGTLIFHPGGWGTGEITSLDLDALEMHVRFRSGRTDRFPLSAAVDIFEHLSESDLRALDFRDAAALKKQLKSEPLEILRAVVERHDGRASTIAIKNALMQVGVEGGSWSAWWRKTRKLAESSEWFRVTGTPARGDVQLLLTKADPIENARQRLSDATLGETLKHVRDAVGIDPALGVALIDLLEEKAAIEDEDPTTRFSAWLLIRERRGETPAPLAELLAATLQEPVPEDPTQPPALWALFRTLATAREQEACLSLLPELYGEDTWRDEAAANLHHAPSGMVRPTIDALKVRHGEALVRTYCELLSRPMRSPEVLIALARLVESGKLEGELPIPLRRAQSLLSLATYLHVHRRADAQLTRAQTRLADFLTTGRDAVLRRLLEGAPYAALKSLQRSLQRGVDESIDNLVTDVVMHSTPDGESARPTHFWENDRIWTTSRGRERRVAELKHLRDVLIPRNEEALGRAAAMGDLSENFEWTTAIEEQRTLGDKKALAEDELARAELIENAILPEDTVSPGTWVRYRDLVSGEKLRIEILGPWDTDDSDDIVSYRAPLAWGLLGKHPREGAHIQLPSGELEVEVIEVGALDLD